ncbi:MAG TPA: hypothetical protein VGM92_02040 [Candidatus Kapabacteria bacterium]|jgi:hypothetical protein
MKHRFLFLFLLLSTPCFAQWKNIGYGNPATAGGPGGTITAMGVHDTFVFVSYGSFQFSGQSFPTAIERFDWAQRMDDGRCRN